MERRFTFDAVAELYEAARPGYPEALFDRVLQVANLRPGDSILELGSGTGKATRRFAERGFRVVAMEPGANLIEVARRSLNRFPNVAMVASTFEDWPLEPARFKLVFAAQSFHWIAPEVRFSKAALALAPGGVLAVFGNTALPVAPPLHDELTRIFVRFAPHLAGLDLGPGWYLPGGVLSKLFEELPPTLGAPSHDGYSWSRPHTSASYVDSLRTESAIQLLPLEQREGLLSSIARAVDAQGGRLELQYETHLYIATRMA
jgi:SAM-dependent methyltransferase